VGTTERERSAPQPMPYNQQLARLNPQIEPASL